MKYLNYILRNLSRNPVRTFLTIASTALTLFLTMILVSFFTIRSEATRAAKIYNRIITMNSSGFTGRVPIARVPEIAALDGVVAVSPFRWFGGKYNEETMPFAQFGVDADTVFRILDEYTIPPTSSRRSSPTRPGASSAEKLAEDRGLKIGDPMPLKGDIFPVDLKLTVRGIYDASIHRDRRMCLFHWDYLDEALKQSTSRRPRASRAWCSSSARTPT